MKLAINPLPKVRLESKTSEEKQLSKAKSQIFSILDKFCQRLLTGLISKNEVQVWKKSSKNGNSEWHAYDPATGQSTCVASDAEMRIWIEQQYYQ